MNDKSFSLTSLMTNGAIKEQLAPSMALGTSSSIPVILSVVVMDEGGQQIQAQKQPTVTVSQKLEVEGYNVDTSKTSTSMGR